MNEQNKLRVVDLNKAKDRGLFDQDTKPLNHEQYEEASGLEPFLATLEPPPIRFKRDSVVVDNNRAWVLKDDMFFGFDFNYGIHLTTESELEGATERLPVGVLIKQKPKRGNQELKATILADADDDEGCNYPMVGYLPDHMPLVSFECLLQFYPKGFEGNFGDLHHRLESVLQAIANNTIQLLDYTSDESVLLSRAEKNTILKKGRGELKPKPGFSLVGDRWHRSGTCLFYDKKHKLCLLFGQDEGTYFGVELPSKVSTIKEAFELLVPEESRVAGTQRQGEWFMVPVKEKDVPATKDCALQFDDEYGDNTFLPLETEDSNRHFIRTNDGRVSKDGVTYALHPKLTHDEHSQISGEGWFKFVKNTAVRAFSQEGVD